MRFAQDPTAKVPGLIKHRPAPLVLCGLLARESGGPQTSWTRDQVLLGEGPQRWVMALFQPWGSPPSLPPGRKHTGGPLACIEGLAHGEVLGTSLMLLEPRFPHLYVERGCSGKLPPTTAEG